jgi:hypothetical protein
MIDVDSRAPGRALSGDRGGADDVGAVGSRRTLNIHAIDQSLSAVAPPRVASHAR